MKIAIASKGKEDDSEVSTVSGRAPYILIYEEGKRSKTIKNPFAVGGGGAGYAVAKILADEKVDIFIAGHFGENMASALEEKGIKNVECEGILVKDALRKHQT